MTIGFRIARRARSVTAAQVAAFRGLPVANVSDCMSRLAAGGARLRPVHASGGMVVQPGDLLLGDEDGFLCVPFDQVDAVREAAAAKQAAEAAQMAEILAGASDRSWVEASLRRLGCHMEA